MRRRVRVIVGLISYCVAYGVWRECIGFALTAADGARRAHAEIDAEEDRGSRIVEVPVESQTGDEYDVEVEVVGGGEAHRERGADAIHFDEFELETG